MARKTLFILVLLLSAGTGLASRAALAGVNLKGVQITEGSQVELVFDAKVDVDQVKTEFIREHIQFSLQKTSVYPAKVNLVQGKELTKVFAYQYAPELVRCRLTMKGDALKYQNRLQVRANGKSLTIRILPESGSSEAIATSAASAERAAATASSTIGAVAAPILSGMVKSASAETKAVKANGSRSIASVAASAAPSAPNAAATGAVTAGNAASGSELSADEKRLVDKVTKNEREVAPAPRESARLTTSKESSSQNRLTTSKNPPSSFRWIGMVLFVFGLLGGFLFFLNRMKNSGQSKGLKNFLGKLGGPGGGKKKVISVVASLPLGPKKSITVVQIQNRMLVLGMSNDAVNLITEFKADDEDFDLADAMNLKDLASGLKDLEDDEIVRPTARAPRIAVDERSEPRLATRAGQVAPSLSANVSASANAAAVRPAPTFAAARGAAQVSAYRDAAGSAANSKPASAFGDILREETARGGVRAQVRSRLEGMKPL